MRHSLEYGFHTPDHFPLAPALLISLLSAACPALQPSAFAVS